MILALVGTFNPIKDAEAFTIYLHAVGASSADAGSQYGLDWRVIDSTEFIPKSDDINAAYRLKR